LQADGRDDVPLLAVHVVDERDARRAVRVVLNRGDLARDADLVALEVNDAVVPLVALPAVAHRDAPDVVAPVRALLVLGQRLVRLADGDLVVRQVSLVAPRGTRWC
jgi:hypothetical protein